jgi:hypothetical protein
MNIHMGKIHKDEHEIKNKNFDKIKIDKVSCDDELKLI